jgi:hypothetical protein
VIADSIAIDELLLVLKIAFLVLLYLFIWQIVRSASRDIRLPQESVILRPSEPGAQMLAGRPAGGRLVVVKSPTLAKGDDFTLNTRAVTIGRGPENDVELRGDEYASASHAHVDPRPDGVWLVDQESTNGTFVNGIRLDAPHRLSSGDVIRVGETQLRFEQ